MRAALEAGVPVLGVCLGAQLLAIAAGGTARPGTGARIGRGDVRTPAATHTAPLFAAVPELLSAGWDLTSYEDAPHHFLAHASRRAA
ncbi:hypothetical protein M878_43110 [Streptomyces roseochromogenus subsp. oscitans DS 12.976]|uniref:Glutamine amidotransferase domain-containing protein n=1 Tax=Streptomyces roseochromogenus subsp. oscitans DS 12.976 TaxID=1352936 RepID=V6JQD0_STRRC|nr:hypothetical protein M878_43110 [Streptomyces roseochromogenus subsp. oscitans DS 12.976]